MAGSIKTRYLVIIGIAVIASLYMFSSTIFKPKLVTQSTNVRFNQWVKNLYGKDGYTVEYNNFDTFKGESDVVISQNANTLFTKIAKAKALTGFITVYFDWEQDVIFYRGTGPDSTLLYCYYASF